MLFHVRIAHKTKHIKSSNSYEDYDWNDTFNDSFNNNNY